MNVLAQPSRAAHDTTQHRRVKVMGLKNDVHAITDRSCAAYRMQEAPTKGNAAQTLVSRSWLIIVVVECRPGCTTLTSNLSVGP